MTTKETAQSQTVTQDTTDSSTAFNTFSFVFVIVCVIAWVILERHDRQVVSSSKIEQLDNSCVIDSVKKELSRSHYEVMTNKILKNLTYNCEKEQEEALQNAQLLRENNVQLKALEKTLN